MNASLPHVAVVIPAWNHWPLTADCLTSLIRVHYPNLHIILVDNGSTDATAEWARRDFPAVEVIRQEQNRGFAAGINLGLRQALKSEAPYILALNNDTLVPPDLFDAPIGTMESESDIGMLTCRINYADDPKRVWTVGSRRRPLTLAALDFGPGRLDAQLATVPRDVDYILGCAVFLRASTLSATGLFDERYFMYYEDLDLCLRFQRAGYRLRYLPQPIILHRVGASTEETQPLRQFLLARSSIRFYAEYGRGRYWLFVPYRLGSALRTVGRLFLKRQPQSAWAYLQGLLAGLRDLRTPTLGPEVFK